MSRIILQISGEKLIDLVKIKGNKLENKNEKELLEKFILNNPDLERLEDLLSQFNIFETLNIVNTEIRHSYVLAWLLNPNANHGLGVYFLKKFLKYLISNNKRSLDPEISVFDFEIFDLSSVEVRREWQNIDLLLILEDEKLEDEKYVIAIENKIGSQEHGDQLSRYRKIIETEFEDSRKIFVYLTPDEATPRSDSEWITFNYRIIGDLIEDTIENKKSSLNENVINFILHYKTILRRHIVGESEIERICKQIYKKHQQALDLIFQHKPDMQKTISEYLKSIISKSDETIYDSSGKTNVDFTTPTLENLVEKISEGWTKSKRILLFDFENTDNHLVLRLYVGPGNLDYRERLLRFFKEDKQETKLFKLAQRTFGKKWHRVYQKEFLRKQDYDDTTFDELKEKIDKKFADFFSEDLIKINRYFKEMWS